MVTRGRMMSCLTLTHLVIAWQAPAFLMWTSAMGPMQSITYPILHIGIGYENLVPLPQIGFVNINAVNCSSSTTPFNPALSEKARKASRIPWNLTTEDVQAWMDLQNIEILKSIYKVIFLSLRNTND